MKKLLISALLPRGLRFKTRGFNSSYLSAYGPVMTLLFPSPSQRYRQLVMNPNMLLWLHDAAGKVDHEGFAARLVKISNYYSPPLHIRGEYFLHYFRLQGSIQWKIYTPVRLLDALHVKLRGWKARNKLSKFTMVSVSILSARMLNAQSSLLSQAECSVKIIAGIIFMIVRCAAAGPSWIWPAGSSRLHCRTLLNPPHPARAPPGPVICCAHLLRIDTSIVHCQHSRHETQMIRANFNIHQSLIPHTATLEIWLGFPSITRRRWHLDYEANNSADTWMEPSITTELATLISATRAEHLINIGISQTCRWCLTRPQLLTLILGREKATTSSPLTQRSAIV